MLSNLHSSIVDPDPYVFEPPGSVIICTDPRIHNTVPLYLLVHLVGWITPSDAFYRPKLCFPTEVCSCLLSVFISLLFFFLPYPPQSAVNPHQSAVNAHQSAVNPHQSAVNPHQSAVYPLFILLSQLFTFKLYYLTCTEYSFLSSFFTFLRMLLIVFNALVPLFLPTSAVF